MKFTVCWQGQLQAPGRNKASLLGERALQDGERLGINKEPWNAYPFQLAIEILGPRQEVGV